MTTVVQDTSNYALVKESVALTAVAIKAPTDLTPLIGKAPTQSGAEAIVKHRERQAALVKRVHESSLVKGMDRIRAVRAELEKTPAFALQLIFDEVKYC